MEKDFEKIEEITISKLKAISSLAYQRHMDGMLKSWKSVKLQMDHEYVDEDK